MIRKTPIAITLAIVIKDKISRNLIGFIIRKILEYLTMYAYVFATKGTNKDFQKTTSQRMHQVLL